jgi:hypothetical protein
VSSQKQRHRCQYKQLFRCGQQVHKNMTSTPHHKHGPEYVGNGLISFKCISQQELCRHHLRIAHLLQVGSYSKILFLLPDKLQESHHYNLLVIYIGTVQRSHHQFFWDNMLECVCIRPIRPMYGYLYGYLYSYPSRVSPNQ